LPGLRTCNTALASANSNVFFSLHSLGSKGYLPPDIFRSKLAELFSTFDGYERIYTDGSKEGEAVAATAVSRYGALVKRLPDLASMFSAEAQAVMLALNTVKQSKSKKVLILLDSLSCLQSIHNRHLQNPLVLEIIIRVHEYLVNGLQITFIWIPSHIGLVGNTAVDAAAKAAVNLPPVHPHTLTSNQCFMLLLQPSGSNRGITKCTTSCTKCSHVSARAGGSICRVETS
jgi:ribonuclease HI